MSELTVLGVSVCIVTCALASSFARRPALLGDRATQPPDGQQAHAHGEKAQDIVHCLSNDPLLTGTVPWKFICADVTSARYATLRVPDVKASNVKLNAFASRRADPFHDKLRRGDDLLTSVTRLAVAGATPEARDAVLGQTTVSELASNQTAENLLLHVAPLTCWRHQIHRGQQNCAALARSAPIGLWSHPVPRSCGVTESSSGTTRHGYCAPVARP